MRWPKLIRLVGMPVLAASAVLALSGCGGHLGNFDAPESGGSKLGALLGFKNNDAPAAEGTQVRHIFCPEIVVLEGTAASQVHAGTPPTSANLRYQFGLTDAARECSLEGDQLTIKIGVAGKVLLGPAGTGGTYNVPVRMAIVRVHGNEPLVSKLYHAAVTVGVAAAEADFTIVSEPLHVPFTQDHTEDDYNIKVGIDDAAGADKAANADKAAGKHAKP